MIFHARIILFTALIIGITGCGKGTSTSQSVTAEGGADSDTGGGPGDLGGVEIPALDPGIVAPGDSAGGGLEGNWQGKLLINGTASTVLQNPGFSFLGDKVTRFGQIVYIPQIQKPGVKDESEDGTYRRSGRAVDLEFPTGKLFALIDLKGDKLRIAYYIRPKSPRPVGFKAGSEGNFLVTHELTREKGGKP